MAKIGFIGLGNMGLPMALNLIKAGHIVTGYDVQAAAMEQFSKAFGLTAANLQQVAMDKDILITMLQTGEQVFKVCQGAEGLLSFAKKGSMYIDCSTIDVLTSQALHNMAKNQHLLVLDAPVSGGVASATAGTLTFIVGGEQETFNKAKPILACMGQKIIYTGGPGSGQAAKICNNLILGASMVAISEAFILGEQLGLAADKLLEVVTNASGQCWAMSHYAPVPGILENVPANNDYKPGFAAAMMLKDLLLGCQAANTMQMELPLTRTTTDLYHHFIDQGFGDLDFSAIINLIKKPQEF